MKVRISTISQSGLKITDHLPLDALNARMQEGRYNDIVFLKAPEVELTVHKTSGGAETKGTVTTLFRQPCSRCLDDIERPLTLPTDYILAPRPEEDAQTYEDDVGISYYEGDHVDLEDLIQETLILSLDQFWHPPIDEHGCCGQCHRNLDAERAQATEEKPQTFGSLLEAARRRK